MEYSVQGVGGAILSGNVQVVSGCGTWGYGFGGDYGGGRMMVGLGKLWQSCDSVSDHQVSGHFHSLFFMCAFQLQAGLKQFGTWNPNP